MKQHGRRPWECAEARLPAGHEFHWNIPRGHIKSAPRFKRVSDWQACEQQARATAVCVGLRYDIVHSRMVVYVRRVRCEGPVFHKCQGCDDTVPCTDSRYCAI